MTARARSTGVCLHPRDSPVVTSSDTSILRRGAYANFCNQAEGGSKSASLLFTLFRVIQKFQIVINRFRLLVTRTEKMYISIGDVSVLTYIGFCFSELILYWFCIGCIMVFRSLSIVSVLYWFHILNLLHSTTFQ